MTDAQEPDTGNRYGQYVFGWWNYACQFGDEVFDIKPVSSFNQAIELVRKLPTFGKEWIHPPITESPTEGVEVPCARFELPATHLLVVKGHAYDKQLGEFLILALGFLRGLRMTPYGTGHLMATPWKECTLVDFLASDKETLVGLTAALDFWISKGDQERKLAFAAIHWFLTSQSYRLQHDVFAWQYTVMDNIHRLTQLGDMAYKATADRAPAHGARPLNLSAYYGSPLPASFAKMIPQPLPTGAVVDLRNELIHEARWCGEPVGYATTADANAMLMEMKHFNAQLILGFLGINCNYRSLPYTWQMAGLDVRT